MAISISIPGPLRSYTGGRDRVALSDPVATVGDALAALFRQHPGVRDRVLNEEGQVRRHVNIFVGTESIRYTGALATPLRDGEEITIVPAVSGG